MSRISRLSRPPGRDLRDGARADGREDGLVNMSMLAMAVIGTLFVVTSILYVAVGSSAAQSNQNAADAAALAGAAAFETAGAAYFAPGFSGSADLRSKVNVTGGCPTVVRAAASSYATKNGATLTSCRMYEWGEVEVSTRMDVPVEGTNDARTRARANWSLDWKSCFVEPSFVAPVTGVAPTWMECAGDRFDLLYVSSLNRYFLQPWGQVKDAIEHEVHLVS